MKVLLRICHVRQYDEPVPPGKREPERLVLTDPRALRALAHPARLTVVDALQQGGERTASELATLTGLSASAMSYHLRALERWGLVKRADSRPDQRERPWTRTARTITWTGDEASPSADAAVQALAAEYLTRLRDDLANWNSAREGWPTEWRDVSSIARGSTFLTADEARSLDQTVQAALNNIVRSRSADQHPPDARRVAYLWVTVPVAENGRAPQARARR